MPNHCLPDLRNPNVILIYFQVATEVDFLPKTNDCQRQNMFNSRYQRQRFFCHNFNDNYFKWVILLLKMFTYVNFNKFPKPIGNVCSLLFFRSRISKFLNVVNRLGNFVSWNKQLNLININLHKNDLFCGLNCKLQN